MSEPPIGFLLGAGARPLPIYKGDVLTIGREPQNSIYLEDALASRQHAAVECNASGVTSVKDLSSRNGTWMNVTRLAEQEAVTLQNGDNFRVGGRIFSYIANDPSLEPRKAGFQASKQLASLETLSAGFFFKNGQVVTEEEPPLPPGNRRTVRATQYTLQTVPPPEAALAGNLQDQGLAQILQFLHANTMTGILTVNGHRLQGELAFDQGRLFFAEAGTLQGPFAVYSCARESAGHFRFEKSQGAPPRPPNITEPTLQVILESCRRMDEVGTETKDGDEKQV